VRKNEPGIVGATMFRGVETMASGVELRHRCRRSDCKKLRMAGTCFNRSREGNKTGTQRESDGEAQKCPTDPSELDFVPDVHCHYQDNNSGACVPVTGGFRKPFPGVLRSRVTQPSALRNRAAISAGAMRVHVSLTCMPNQSPTGLGAVIPA